MALSSVTINEKFQKWYGLGPISMHPDWQRQGIGKALIGTGLDRLMAMGTNGCVLLGEPEYYGRFGFRAESQLQLRGVAPEFFLVLPLASPIPTGYANYHSAFSQVA